MFFSVTDENDKPFLGLPDMIETCAEALGAAVERVVHSPSVETSAHVFAHYENGDVVGVYVVCRVPVEGRSSFRILSALDSAQADGVRKILNRPSNLTAFDTFDGQDAETALRVVEAMTR